MIYVVYIFAAIGALVVAATAVLAASFWAVKRIARAELRRRARLGTLTPSPAQAPTS